MHKSSPDDRKFGSLSFSLIPIENVRILLNELCNIFARPTMGCPRISGNALMIAVATLGLLLHSYPIHILIQYKYRANARGG